MIIIKGIEYGMVHEQLMILNYCSVTIYGGIDFSMAS